MKKTIVLIAIIALLFGCNNAQQVDIPAPTFTSSLNTPRRTEWSVYNADPNHLWNRVFRQLYRRTAATGEEYGFDELDPLLWLDTTYLLTGTSHGQTIQVLDEFLSSHADGLVRDALKRAMFQRDLWAVFDWLASQSEPYSSERLALETRLARMIRSVALSKEDILSLPDNYAREVESNAFPTGPVAYHPELAFLPSDPFEPDSAWVCMGRNGGPVAITHTEAFPFFGRSAFLVFVRSPHGRAATLDFIESLNTEPNPVTAIGSDVALVRRMLLIDDQGEIVLAPLVETIQIRHFSPTQHFYEFELNRTRLFDGFGGGLVPNANLFMLFMGHGDVFESSTSETQATIPEICRACHFEYPSIPNSGNTQSIISYSRQPFSLPGNKKPILFATTLMEEAGSVIEWKQQHRTWNSLKVLWD